MNSNLIKRNIQSVISKKKNKNHFLINSLKLYQKLTIPYPMKQYYNNIIPLNIFQTWHTKNLPPLMNNAVNLIKNNNPAFNYYLYDDNDCRNFINNNFSDDILNAYDSLVPGAYKADLWRYCILYKHGGIYLDIKYIPLNGFKFINLTEKEHWVLDADNNGIYNALIVCLPGNDILWRAINQIVEHVRNRYYGSGSLEPTGPLLLARYFNSEQKKHFDMYHSWHLNHDHRFIFYNNYMILKQYNGYRDEHNKNEKVAHYDYLWKIHKIYK